MREGFETKTLGELSIGNKGEYGIGAPSVEYAPELYKYLRITDISDVGTIDLNNMVCVSDLNAMKYLLQPNDIVFARTGASTGRSYFYTGDEGPLVYAGFLIKFSINPEKVNPQFVKYYAMSNEYKGWIQSFNAGSTRGNINAKTYADMPIKLPSRETQDLLVKTLSCLDDKIANNAKINHHLEQMAQAIFKSWFVDFGPWGGVMPEEWRVERLGNFCESVSKTHSREKEQLIFLNTGDIDNGIFLHSVYSLVRDMPGQAKKSIQRDDILYSEIRPINRHFAYVTFDADDYIVSTKLMVIRARGIDSRRLYHYLTSDDIITELQIEAESRSGTFPQIRFDNIQQLEILLATPDIECDFAEILHDTYASIDANNAESSRLAALRDALLPKLMSGELDVSSIQI